MTTTDDTSQVPPPPPAPEPSTPAVRRLERSTDDRIVSGVCGGLGRYFDVDPVIFRVLFAVMAVFGAGFVAYGAAWLFVPEERGGGSVVGDFRGGGGPGRELVIIVLVVIAGIIAVDGLFGASNIGGDGWFWPVLVLVGIAYFWRRHQPNAGHQPHVDHGPHNGHWDWQRGSGRRAPWFGPPLPVPPVPPVPPAPPVPPWSGTPAPEAPPAPSEFWAATATTPAAAGPVPPATEASEPWGATIPPVKPPREKSALGTITFSILLLALGVAALLNALNAIELSTQGVLAGALIVIGLALITGAWIGRARGLIFLGLILTLAVSAVAALDVPLRGGIGDRTWHPTTTEQLARPLRLAVGDAVLDLTDAPVREGHHEIHTSVGLGQLTVILPPGVNAHISGRVAVGDLRLFNDEQGGRDVRVDHADTPSADLVIDARVGLGELVVQREAS